MEGTVRWSSTKSLSPPQIVSAKEGNSALNLCTIGAACGFF